MSTDQEWAGLRGGLPSHDDEVMTAHQGAPSIAVQAVTHGAGIPDQDNGMTEAAKYGTSPAVC